ncbi:hypothetical protein CDAR_520662 [Caerostris darwini]|uniref:HTH psq-type domain-containing protein n=1 Tax=Caerostris darwini TaxID=1538125 RepID=A0AAV4VJX9_9ARAC|nr:hypothetical protein CDAR_520662 [Caerostris darwini]
MAPKKSELLISLREKIVSLRENGLSYREIGKKSSPTTISNTDPKPIPGAKISFSSFKQSFASTTSYLRRRFSSGDLSGELDDQDRRIEQEGEDGPSEVSQSQEPDLALHVRQGTTISAPTSPSKNVPAFQQRANSVTAGSVMKAPSAKDKHKTVLVIDDQHTDWARS